MVEQGMKTLAKGLDILNLFLDKRKELSIADISKLSGVNKSTSYRIASTLVKYGYLTQRERRGNYSLGLTGLRFCQAINLKLYFRNIALPYLGKLSEKVNEEAVIAYANGEDDVIPEVFPFESQHQYILSITPKVGEKLPLNSTSLGKIILSSLSEKSLQNYFDNRELKKTAPNTITDINVMRDHLKTIKAEGIAFDDEEWNLGIRGVAAGVKDAKGDAVASIGVFAPSVRMTYTRMHELGPIIREYAITISKELGYQG
jgi:IclR family transcriptional regulator, KDG regulon repressor